MIAVVVAVWLCGGLLGLGLLAWERLQLRLEAIGSHIHALYEALAVQSKQLEARLEERADEMSATAQLQLLSKRFRHLNRLEQVMRGAEMDIEGEV